MNKLKLLLIACFIQILFCKYLNEPFDWTISVPTFDKMVTNNARIAATYKNNIIGFDLSFVHDQKTPNAIPNLLMDMGNKSIPAITSTYSLYSVNTGNGFIVKIYDRFWQETFSKKWESKSMYNFAAGEYYLEDGMFTTFVVFYEVNGMRVGEVFEEYPIGTFKKVKELTQEGELWADKIAINDNYLVLSLQVQNQAKAEKIYWRENKKEDSYSVIKTITNENVPIERILIKQGHIVIAFKSYSQIYKTNKALGSVIRMSEINENILDISMYDNYNEGYVIYLDDLYTPNICTWDIANSDCKQIITFYPTNFVKDTVPIFDKHSGTFVVSMSDTLFVSTVCSPNSKREAGINGTFTCKGCMPGTSNPGYSHECAPCYYLPPKWAIYGPNAGCGWQCLLGKDANNKCIPLEKSFVFWSSAVTTLTVVISICVIPIFFCTCASFGTFVFALTILFFGIFASLPTFGYYLFDFLMDGNHHVSFYDAFFLRLLMLGVPSFFAIILLTVYCISCQMTKKTANPKYANFKKYPPTKIYAFMSIGMIIACTPGFVLSLMQFVNTGITMWNISLLYQGIFWYFVPLVIAITSFCVTTCMWYFHSRERDYQQFTYERLNVNNIENSGESSFSLNEQKNLSHNNNNNFIQSVTVSSDVAVCGNCGGGGKVTDGNQIFNCHYCRGRGVIENI